MCKYYKITKIDDQNIMWNNMSYQVVSYKSKQRRTRLRMDLWHTLTNGLRLVLKDIQQG
jgi:hypothetical protein